MKRYAAFANERYYPLGGFQDFVGDFDTVEEGKAAVAAHHISNGSTFPEGHIADLQDKKIVCSFDEQDGWQDEAPASLAERSRIR